MKVKPDKLTYLLAYMQVFQMASWFSNVFGDIISIIFIVVSKTKMFAKHVIKYAMMYSFLFQVESHFGGSLNDSIYGCLLLQRWISLNIITCILIAISRKWHLQKQENATLLDCCAKVAICWL